MKILVHTCCVNCLLYPHKRLKEKFKDIHIYWFNPNIHPFTEYEKRLDSLAEYTKSENLNLINIPSYHLEEFLRKSVYRENLRCYQCYYWRLESCAKAAKKSGFDCFTTTLLYSKMQNHEMIIDICKSLSRKIGIDFYYEDFREGWKEGIEISNRLNTYRQQYCGCIYSEKERYLGKKAR